MDSTSFDSFSVIFQPEIEKLKKTLFQLTEPKPFPPIKDNKLNTIAFIKEYGLNALETELSISVTRYPELPQLVHLSTDYHYSPICPIVDECSNGLVLDESKDFSVVSMAHKRIFIYEKGEAEKVDIESVRAYDMSIFESSRLVTLFHYNNEWRISSSTSPNAKEETLCTNCSGNIWYYFTKRSYYNAWRPPASESIESEKFFVSNRAAYGQVTGQQPIFYSNLNDLFWKIWSEHKYKLPPLEYSHMSFCFRVSAGRLNGFSVLQTKNPEIVLFSAHNLITLEEISPDIPAKLFGWDCLFDKPKEIQISNFEDLKKTIRYYDPTSSSGLILVDKLFNKITILSPQYQALKNILWSHQTKEQDLLMLEIVHCNTHETFLQFFPLLRSIHQRNKERFEKFLSDIKEPYNQIKDKDSKSFAMVANTKEPDLKYLLFHLKDVGVRDVDMFFHEMDFETLISKRWMKIKK